MPSRNPLETFNDRYMRLNNGHALPKDGLSLYNPLNLLVKQTQAAGTDWDFDLLGTGTVPDPAFDSTGVGQVIATRTTSAADNDEALYFPLSTSLWNTSLAPSTTIVSRWETIIKTPASNLSTTLIWAGLKLTGTGVLATDNDQALFIFDPDVSTSYWTAAYSVAGTDTQTTLSSTTALAVSTIYRLGIVLGTDLKARFYINGNLVSTSAALTAAAAFKPGAGVIARTDGSPAARSASFGWVRTARQLT